MEIGGDKQRRPDQQSSTSSFKTHPLSKRCGGRSKYGTRTPKTGLHQRHHHQDDQIFCRTIYVCDPTLVENILVGIEPFPINNFSPPGGLYRLVHQAPPTIIVGKDHVDKNRTPSGMSSSGGMG